MRCGSFGSKATSSGMSGGVRDSKPAPPSPLTWMSVSSARTATTWSPGACRMWKSLSPSSADRLPRVAGVARADQPEVLGQRRAAALGVAGAEQLPRTGVADDEVARHRAGAVGRGQLAGDALGLARALLGAEQAEAGADHQRAVGGVDGERADEGVRGAARLGGSAGSASIVGFGVGVVGRAAVSGGSSPPQPAIASTSQQDGEARARRGRIRRCRGPALPAENVSSVRRSGTPRRRRARAARARRCG